MERGRWKALGLGVEISEIWEFGLVVAVCGVER